MEVTVPPNQTVDVEFPNILEKRNTGNQRTLLC